MTIVNKIEQLWIKHPAYKAFARNISAEQILKKRHGRVLPAFDRF